MSDEIKYDKQGRPMSQTGGRPTKLNDDLIERVSQAIRNGAYIETAMKFVGVHVDQFYEWNKRAVQELKERNDAENQGIDRTPKYELYVRFHEAIQKAMAESELFDLNVITRAARDGIWQAAAWRLERKYPKRYGQNRTESADENVEASAELKIVIEDATDNDRLGEIAKGLVNGNKNS